MSYCAGCNAKVIRVNLKDGLFNIDPDGMFHAFAAPGGNHELSVCTRKKREHEHYFEKLEFCNGSRVCVECGEHANKERCMFCGWSGKPDIIEKHGKLEFVNPLKNSIKTFFSRMV